METLHLRPRLLRSYVGPATSVATVETELVTRAPSQLRRPRGSPFRPRACLCASIVIFRIARASLERALTAQTPLDPYCRFSEFASYTRWEIAVAPVRGVCRSQETGPTPSSQRAAKASTGAHRVSTDLSCKHSLATTLLVVRVILLGLVVDERVPPPGHKREGSIHWRFQSEHLVDQGVVRPLAQPPPPLKPELAAGTGLLSRRGRLSQPEKGAAPQPDQSAWPPF